MSFDTLGYGDKIYIEHPGYNMKIEENSMRRTLASNLIFPRSDLDYYNKINRFGFIDPYYTDSSTIEYVFFTKPDLNLFNAEVNSFYTTCELNDNVAHIPFFAYNAKTHKDAMLQLQYSIKDVHGENYPFMCLLTNSMNSSLDLPGISSDANESTVNTHGVSLQYRGHSMKSNNGYDFSIGVNDTTTLDIYHMVKTYDEFIKAAKLNHVEVQKNYILNNIFWDQFSIYKFLVWKGDGETILYFAKFTGVFFTDVPRGEFGDPGVDGFKYSLGLHAQFVHDMDPLIIDDFNRLTNPMTTYYTVYDQGTGGINNAWGRYPRIDRTEPDSFSARLNKGKSTQLLKLRWYIK